MLVWLKNPTTGVFEKSGMFPEGCRAMIAIDTDKPAGDYTIEAALALVGNMIGQGKDCSNYRFEIHPTTASQLCKTAPNADIESQIAHLQETRGLSRKSAMQIIRRAKAAAGKAPKAKATRKPKPATKAKRQPPKPGVAAFKADAKAARKSKSTGWAAKRATEIASPRFQKAYAKALENTSRKECAHGHKISPENTHVGDLYRLGNITCDPCNRAAQERWAANRAKKGGKR
jgi:hypothetical protein